MIVDPIYGEFELEPVLMSLIESEAVQRLKKVHQAGASYLVNPHWNVTRYEHSIGVMLVIRQLGGSLPEQIAGLLHDVSHTAFSHVVDVALENKEENYHELIRHGLLTQSDIPDILGTYGFNWRDILTNDEQWPLLEQDLPDLCADRIDYTLRDSFHYFNNTLEEIRAFIKCLTIETGKIVVKSQEQGEWFVRKYYQVVIDFFYAPLNIFSADRMAKIIQYSLRNDFIHSTDLLLDDQQLLERLKSTFDPYLNQLFCQLEVPPILMEGETNHLLFQRLKRRIIDPLILFDNNTIVKGSTVSLEIKKLNESAEKRSQEGIYIRLGK
ncbi:HD domain-containing protein [Vagococcus sp. BWB3-3]|uniref:HD domain-containing protein n=1 Tax=Vagococcus allomyrinae TaxID=2794353 RepID=A0A940P5C3_9ENTE|nr:HD domain-containing protein [Vagococcus allomyrinae]MBP1041707.1 HD domain-containing protein [Vagococcus allomyrinae]